MEIALSIVALVFSILAFMCALIALNHQAIASETNLTGRTVVVHTKRPDDRTVKGILHGQYEDRIVLRDAVLIEGARQVPLGGVEHVPVSSVSFIQEVEAPVVPITNGRAGA